MSGELRYAVHHDFDWNVAGALTGRVTLLPDEDDPIEIRVEGPCPACGHDTLHIEPLFLLTGVSADEIDESITRGFRDLLRKSGKSISSRDVEVVCACSSAHEGAPVGATGCGRSWVLTVAWGDGV